MHEGTTYRTAIGIKNDDTFTQIPEAISHIVPILLPKEEFVDSHTIL